MFLPTSAAEASKAAEEEKQKKVNYKKIEEWCKALVPEDIRKDVDISVSEVVCGDPSCAPIDTAITISFINEGGKSGMTGIPAESKDITEEDVRHSFPTADVLNAWHRGEEHEWPPDYDDGDIPADMFPPLRFDLGTRVECRVSQDSWVAGKIIQLWYREPHWPKMSWAPYKILLDDGRNIFAPGDSDQVIRIEGGGEGGA